MSYGVLGRVAKYQILKEACIDDFFISVNYDINIDSRMGKGKCGAKLFPCHPVALLRSASFIYLLGLLIY